MLDGLDHVGPQRGWEQHATNLETSQIPGDHTDFVLDPHAATLAAVLLARLDRAVAATTR